MWPPNLKLLQGSKKSLPPTSGKGTVLTVGATGATTTTPSEPGTVSTVGKPSQLVLLGPRPIDWLDHHYPWLWYHPIHEEEMTEPEGVLHGIRSYRVLSLLNISLIVELHWAKLPNLHSAPVVGLRTRWQFGSARKQGS